MNKMWAALWFSFGLYSVIAVHGGGGMTMAAIAMLSGFMTARNLAEVFMTHNALAHRASEASPVQRTVGRKPLEE